MYLRGQLRSFPNNIIPVTSIAGDVAGALADRYRIERTLGAGGMATVYLAADLKHDRKVAIKVLKPELAAGYDVTPDGAQFVRVEPVARPNAQPTVVVLNWFAELKRKVPR